MQSRTLKSFASASKYLLLAGSAASMLGLVHAVPTEVASAPLITASGTPVKPNLMFILDDSGSMAAEYLPEVASFGNTKYGGPSAQCNGLAYNPATTYAPPLNHLGVSIGDASLDKAFPAATALSGTHRAATPSPLAIAAAGDIITLQVPSAGGSSYDTGDEVTIYSDTSPTQWMTGVVVSWAKPTLKVKISASRSMASGSLVGVRVVRALPASNVYYTYSGSQPALSYTYGEFGAVSKDSTFYKECNSNIGNTPGKTVFTAVSVDLTYANLKNYANWRAYYSNRMLMMKTVVSQAFKDINQKFRIGFSTISNKEATESTNKKFLHIRDFDADQKEKFYASLMAAPTSGYTPLRGALSNAGRYYARKAPGQGTEDPVQYSCQKNYALLSSDGAWNSDNESDNYGPFGLESANGKPVKVGDQDGEAATPMKDHSPYANSLADVAMYFYNTDLRSDKWSNCSGSITDVGVCQDTALDPATGKPQHPIQRMNTFTLSLGQNGTLTYDKNYETQRTGDFAQLKDGHKKWPSPDNDAARVDDLWHAAVNGRGVFFNAADPKGVTDGLTSALDKMNEIPASGAAAATSTLRPSKGDNQVFIARYTSGVWTGDVRAYKIDPTTGVPNIVQDPKDPKNDNADWSAAKQLDKRETRRILFRASGGALEEFDYDRLSAAQKAMFDGRCSSAPVLTQCAKLDTGKKDIANNGKTLVNYLRGVEQPNVFRSRTSKLGDMVGSSPAFVGKPPMKYKDDGYAAYQSKPEVSGRKPVVYVGANDGMLHAFDAATGEELWAYIPGQVMGNLYKLADADYGEQHQFYVDGAPVVADVQGSDGAWRTVLVAGLGAGGAGYFALDVTNPEKPVSLWEFTEPGKLGLSVATPLVTKHKNTWVVAVTSGLNNSDGYGYLFMFDVIKGPGEFRKTIATAAFDPTLPEGMGPANAWVEAMDDNTAVRFYAGDMQGRVWRFDPEAGTAFQLAQLTLGGKVQPITTQPQLALVNYKGFKTAVVYIGTGRLLAQGDIGQAKLGTQTVYGIRDDLSAVPLGDVRNNGALVGQTLTTSGSTRTASGNPVDWTKKSGWYVDLPDTGERVNVDMLLQFNTLTAVSNVPTSVASCSAGGYAWIYYFDIANGSNTGNNVATKVEDSMVVGLSAFVLEDGRNGVIINKSLKDPSSQILPTPTAAFSGGRRTSWRELVDR
ncbi:pilus assembly protein [Paucibacter sp. XJ19-41]|uniref:pilus assembly protein n=1 Tax=Paucibacter sp. XJ19-41 TaxID=2927824 RepID=UPI002349568D|nr:PilC/PilY family type IV pilus protein [Paucibacter sp. XJ19-41]MDC6166071.1 PilC/PilY family type IV pilus protein [Paucibacter sp. XJ19-41]